MKKITIEPSAPFQGLPFMVAMEKGFLADEGIEVEVRGPMDYWNPEHMVASAELSTRLDVQYWNQVASNRGHAAELDNNQADLYWGCEWGNYRRAQDTMQDGRQIGRRAIVTCGAVIVPPWSDIYTPQQLANRLVAVPFHAGTHYLTIQMLEGFLPKELIKVCDASGAAGPRYHSLMKGEVDACSVTEPYITLAEKNGCRVICQAFYHGTDVATHAIDAATYASINRAVSKAVKFLNSDKRGAAQMFIDWHKSDSEIEALTPDDFNLSRLVFTDPSPIPEDELKRTYDWMVSWDMIDGGHTTDDLVRTNVQEQAHHLVSRPQ